ncbi:MAG: TIGR00730 family Rossman fold protein [Marinifilaceae bacterium]|nr:TIGR00730 family Rossman fold protein [Marinifilaceae bacterium]
MNVCVFCASSEVDRKYFNVAGELGKQIVANGWNLLYGGTNCGLMREVSDMVEECGGRVTGVIPQCIVDKGKAALGLTKLIVTPDMKERKSVMREMSDAFIALPGGWGTLEEITEVITLKQLGVHNKPIVFLNTNDYFEYFFLFIHNARKERFISAAYDDLYFVTDSVEEAMEYIRNYSPEKIKDKY